MIHEISTGRITLERLKEIIDNHATLVLSDEAKQAKRERKEARKAERQAKREAKKAEKAAKKEAKKAEKSKKKSFLFF